MNFFQQQLDALKEQGLLRFLREQQNPPGSYVEYEGRKLLNLSSNNYLGLANHPDLKKAAGEAVQQWGTGAGGSRLLTGTQSLHSRLEERVASWHGCEKALVLNSGYAANFGILQALVPAFAHVLCDKLNHASIIDGLRQGNVPFTRYRHLDLEHLESLLKQQQSPGKTMMVTETLFSMEGDFLPLKEVLSLQEKYGFFLYLDEAHSVGGYPGLLQPLSQADPSKVLIMGTFGKALGGFGAFAAGTGEQIDFLVNMCRSFIFSTSLPPAVTASAMASFEVLQKEEWRIGKLHTLSGSVLEKLHGQGFDTGRSSSHIIPVILGDNQRAVSASEQLISQGVYLLPVRPPAVPAGTARLRMSLHCEMEEAELDRVIECLKEAV